MPMGHRARFLALAGVCVFLTSLALAACGSATSARSVSPGFTGYDWQVAAISHSGTYRTTSDGFTTSALASTLVGYAGHDPAVLLAIGAIGSFGNGVHATVKLTGDRLVVGVDSYTLTCQRRGSRADVPAPAGTGE